MNNNFINQVFKLCSITILSLPQRITSSFVAIFSICCVTAVLLSVLTLISGMNKTMQQSGFDNTLIAMRSGSMSEVQSVLFPIEVRTMLNHPKVLRDENNRAIFSSELFVNIDTQLPGVEKSQNLALRGVSSVADKMRPNFKIEQGRYFKSGVRQVIIGQAIVLKNPGVTVGSTIKLGGSDWLVAGIFSDNFSVFESEIWTDLRSVQNDYQRGISIQSVRISFEKDIDIATLQQEWDDDPRLNVRVISEREFFAQQSKDITRLMRWLGIPLAVVMALGAIVAALNTMYSAIAARRAEIAVQKAIGFNPTAIAASVVFESVILAVIGGLAGILPLYFGLNGSTTATNSGASLGQSQIMFNFTVSPELMASALGIAVMIGLVGGILPAVHAIKLPVTRALRLD